MVLAPPDGRGSATVATHDLQGAIAVHPVGARSLQVAHHSHSVGAISASDTRRGPRVLGSGVGAMTYAVSDHESRPGRLAVEEASEMSLSGASACPDPFWGGRGRVWGRLAGARWISARRRPFSAI